MEEKLYLLGAVVSTVFLLMRTSTILKKHPLYIWVWNGYNELILVLDLENFLFSLLLPIAEDFDHLGAHYATKRPNAPSFAENMCA